VFQAGSWIVGASKIAQGRNGGSPLRIFRAGVGPGLMAVVAQDTAALLGILFAFLGILGDRVLGLRILDPIASMCIGVLVAGMALVLARERSSLLLGETAWTDSIQRVRSAIQREPSVASVGEVWGMHLGPDELLVSCEVAFQHDPPGVTAEEAIDRVEKAARAAEPRASRVFIAVQSARSLKRAGSSDRPRGTNASLSSR
jgi:divalent metal cation (Fe/Co/Zn/Cd) transporter